MHTLIAILLACTAVQPLEDDPHRCHLCCLKVAIMERLEKQMLELLDQAERYKHEANQILQEYKDAGCVDEDRATDEDCRAIRERHAGVYQLYVNTLFDLHAASDHHQILMDQFWDDCGFEFFEVCDCGTMPT